MPLPLLALNFPSRSALVYAIAFAAVLLVMFARYFLRDIRIGAYIESLGGRVLELRKLRFDTRWAGYGKGPLYYICYEDRDGIRREAFCKVKRLSGVYLFEDSVAEPTPEFVTKVLETNDRAAARREDPANAPK